MPPVGVEREGRDQQRGQAERLVARASARARRPGTGRRAPSASTARPSGPTSRAPLLDRPVGEQLGATRRGLGRAPARAVTAPCRRGPVARCACTAACGVRRRVARRRRRPRPGAGRASRSVVDGRRAAARPGPAAASRSGSTTSGVEARPPGAAPSAREGQPQHAARGPPRPRQLGREPGDRGRHGVAGRAPRRPAHRRRCAERDGRLVGDRERRRRSRRRTGPRPPAVVALGRGPQRGQRLHPGGVERRAGVGGAQHARRAASSRSRPGYAGAGGRVGGVLRQLDDQPVAVAAEGEVLLGVGVLAEPRGRGRPRGEDPARAAPPCRTGRPSCRAHPARRGGVAGDRGASGARSAVGRGPPRRAALARRHHVVAHLVDDRRRGLDGGGLHDGLGVRAAAVVERDDLPSSGAYSLAHTPNDLAQRARQRHEERRKWCTAPGAARDRASPGRGRRSTSGSAASSRPSADSTRGRPRPSSQRARASGSSASPVCVKPGASRGSSGGGRQQVAGPDVTGAQPRRSTAPIRGPASRRRRGAGTLSLTVTCWRARRGRPRRPSATRGRPGSRQVK